MSQSSNKSQGLKHFFDWYQSEKPPFSRVMDVNAPLTWLEHSAITCSAQFIQRSIAQEGGSEPSLEQVFEQHTPWLRNLSEGQLKLWNETPRS